MWTRRSFTALEPYRRIWTRAGLLYVLLSPLELDVCTPPFFTFPFRFRPYHRARHLVPRPAVESQATVVLGQPWPTFPRRLRSRACEVTAAHFVLSPFFSSCVYILDHPFNR